MVEIIGTVLFFFRSSRSLRGDMHNMQRFYY